MASPLSLPGIIGGQLFNRKYSVSFGPQVALGIPLDLFSFDSLRVKFEVDKLGLGTSSKAKIEIYNLSPIHRQAIKKGWAVVVKAGYQTGLGILSSPTTIFQGVVGLGGAYTKRDGSALITTMECGDGEQQMVMSTLDRSYPTGTPMALVITDVIANSGLLPGIVAGVPTTVFSKGYTAHGQIRKTLDELCRRGGLAWSVNNGSINIVPIKGFDGVPAEVISASTGMIGVPSIENGVLKFSNLMNPKLFPGSVVLVKSANVGGLLGAVIPGNQGIVGKINRAKYIGDSHDSKWQVECECVSFSAAGGIL